MSSFSEDSDPSSPLSDGPPPARKTKESFLQWWALIPIGILIAIEAAFGRPAPNAARANDAYNFGYVFGYVAGNTIAYLVLALLGGWVTYHVTRKSRLGATLMFTLGIAFFSFVVVGTWARGRMDRGAPDARRSQLADPARRH